MAEAVGRGEVVEIPGGKIYTVARKPRREWHWFWNIGTNQKEYRMVQYNRGGKGIQFKPAFKLELKAAAPQKEKARGDAHRKAMAWEIEHLTADLLGRRPDDSDFRALIRALEQQPHKPDSLVSRLRVIKTQAIPPLSIDKLCQWIQKIWYK